MEKKWIQTEQMLEDLKNDPDYEQEYTHYLGGILRCDTYQVPHDTYQVPVISRFGYNRMSVEPNRPICTA